MRTTRFGNGAEEVRNLDHTGSDQAGRDGGTTKGQKDTEEDETLDDLQQKEDERGTRSIQPLLKATSEAAERSSSKPANVTVLWRFDQ